MPRIFGRNGIDAFQSFQRAQRNIAQISDWRRDYV
jgi:hypothetical protein